MRRTTSSPPTPRSRCVLPDKEADGLEVAIEDVAATVADEYEIADPHVRIDLGPADLPERVFSREATRG